MPRLSRALELLALLAKFIGAIGMMAALGRVAWLVWPRPGAVSRLGIHEALVFGVLWGIAWAALALLLAHAARRAGRRKPGGVEADARRVV